MDSLLDTNISGVPKDYYLSCYYVIDSHLRYISLVDHDLFHLHYVDSDVVGQKIAESKKEHEFDAFVYNKSKPICSMQSNYENIENKKIRVVRIKTSSGNPISRKAKKPYEKSILTRYSNNNKKLF